MGNQDEIQALECQIEDLETQLNKATERFEDFHLSLKMQVARIRDAAIFPNINREDEIRLLIETILDFQD